MVELLATLGVIWLSMKLLVPLALGAITAYVLLGLIITDWRMNRERRAKHARSKSSASDR
jgi:ABC-type transport system involved in Fe-S cluster assembly fused permease/ATPase subunit